MLSLGRRSLQGGVVNRTNGRVRGVLLAAGGMSPPVAANYCSLLLKRRSGLGRTRRELAESNAGLCGHGLGLGIVQQLRPELTCLRRIVCGLKGPCCFGLLERALVLEGRRVRRRLV